MGDAIRLIDAEPEPPRDGAEMEVLVLGMPRLGTLSLVAAFNILGYRPLHESMMDQNPHLLGLFLEALQARFQGTVKPYGRNEFDKVFMGRWNVSCNNMPVTLLTDDVIKAYPNAKIILTTRDGQHSDPAVKWKRIFDWMASWDPDHIGLWWYYHKYQRALRPILAPDGEDQAYLNHYKRLNELPPPDRALDYDVADGWEPLCKFLGRDVPSVPFPVVKNRTSSLGQQMMRLMLRKIAMRVFWFVAVACAVLLTTGGDIWLHLFGLMNRCFWRFVEKANGEI